MYSTWVDNDHGADNSLRRIDSASKKPHQNRIQIVSKLGNNNGSTGPGHLPAGDRNIPPPSYPSQTKIEQLNQTTPQLPIRRLNTTDCTPTDPDSSPTSLYSNPNPNTNTNTNTTMNSNPNINILKLMQEQLELVRKSYEEKIKQQLRLNSIQLSKLDIKIQNNNELIASKDKLIEQLKGELRRGSPVRTSTNQLLQSPQSPPQMPQPLSLPPNILQKISDIENKFNSLIENQNKLGMRMGEINVKIQCVEKGLLSLLACKLAKMQGRVGEFVDLAGLRVGGIEAAVGRVGGKGGQLYGYPQPHSHILDNLTQKLQSLKQQLLTFKTKQFRYENSSLALLKRDIAALQSTVQDLQRKFHLAHSKLKNSKSSSSRKGYDMERRGNSNNNSCFFQDYEEVYEDVDSIGEDQFFHPLQQSTRKYTQKQHPKPSPFNPHPHPHPHPQPHILSYTHTTSTSKPAPSHNDSFQNFTSDEQDQQILTHNEKRLLHTIRDNKFKMPLVIQIDLTGFIRKKMDQKYLLDRDKKGFMLNQGELGRCKGKGWIVW